MAEHWKEETTTTWRIPREMWRLVYAGMAMQGLCASYPNQRRLAEASVRIADALLAELEKPEGSGGDE